MVSAVLIFANEILSEKGVRNSSLIEFIQSFLSIQAQLRSQVALSLLQCCLHLPANVFFVNHSNICRLLSLLIKYHSTTLGKHVPTIEMLIKCKYKEKKSPTKSEFTWFSTGRIDCFSCEGERKYRGRIHRSWSQCNQVKLDLKRMSLFFVSISNGNILD